MKTLRTCFSSFSTHRLTSTLHRMKINLVLVFMMIFPIVVNGQIDELPSDESVRILSDPYVQQALENDLPWLASAYPNPAHGEVAIPFGVPEDSDGMQVTIKIFNSQGIEVGTPVNQIMDSGNYEVTWSAEDLSGMHIIRMRIGLEETRAIRVLFN
jgi:hypothetical protein